MRKTMSRAAIVNADDFGQSAGINRGIVEAHERGIVTSASLMVRWPAASAAAAYARAHPRLSVGLHVDLGESIYRDGEWIALYERVDRADARAARSGNSFAALDLPRAAEARSDASRLAPARAPRGARSLDP